ncbi:Hypothetical Protein sle_60960 [Streptomyces leeuwenhoekii]|uniref:Uncharacterized protein n=1 Tax=Streptomyces leeuwenhoekii TaxID=1437453 RepID=A0A0F7W6P6_STRLW|nr:Hypothetical Protein sle_60960 [Streptomyces leeuwenhoekii]
MMVAWRSPFGAAEDRNHSGTTASGYTTSNWRSPSGAAEDRNKWKRLIYEVSP